MLEAVESPIDPDRWSEAVAYDCVPVERNGRPALQVCRRFWREKDGDWFDSVVQYLTAQPRDSGDGGTLHDDLAGWPEETRAWAVLAFADARLDVRLWRASIAHGSVADAPEPELGRIPYAPNADPDPHPVFAGLDVVEDEQRRLHRQEARRVVAAQNAWHAAQQEEDRPTANDTPYQRGFFVDLGLKLKVSDATAKILVHTADALEFKTPAVWRAFLGGDAPWRAMQAVHTALDGLRADVLDEFDRRAATKVVEVPTPRLGDALRRLAEQLQSSDADERHDRATARRTVTTELLRDGMATTTIYWPAVNALALEHQLTKGAIAAHGKDGDTRGIAQLKVDVLGDVLIAFLRRDAKVGSGVSVPARPDVEPKIAILIPAMTALGRSTASPVLKGYGPIGIATALRLAAEAKSWIRVLTDPITGGVLDLARKRYRPSKDMRAVLRILDGGGRGPGCPRGPDDVDVDHAKAYHQNDEAGATAVANLMLLSRKQHVAKSAGELQPTLMPDRTVVWRTRAGNSYVTRPHDPLQPTPVPPELIDPQDDRPPF